MSNVWNKVAFVQNMLKIIYIWFDSCLKQKTKLGDEDLINYELCYNNWIIKSQIILNILQTNSKQFCKKIILILI